MLQLKQSGMQSKNITIKHVSYLRREQRKGNELILSFFMDSGEYVIEMQRFIQNSVTVKNTVISPHFRCGNFVERYSFCRVSGDSPETMRKLCLSTKFSHQEIR